MLGGVCGEVECLGGILLKIQFCSLISFETISIPRIKVVA